MPSNADLIPIYTDWANRYLAKAGGTTWKPIRDISNELRDYRLVAQLINVIVPPNGFSAAFNSQLAKTSTNIDGLETCLHYLLSVGIECTKLTSKDIDSGHLGAVLQLLYLLSTFKQRIRQQKRELKKLESVMPPSASKLPSPLRPPTSSATPTTSISTTMTPTRIAVPPPRGSKSQPSAAAKTSGLKPPSSGLRPPSRSSCNNNGSTTSTRSTSSIASSATYASIPSSVSPTPKSTQQQTTASTSTSTLNNSLATPTLKRPQTQTSTTRTTTTTTRLAPPKVVTKAANDSSEGSMLKLKLFNKKQPSPQPSPGLLRKGALKEPKGTSTSTISTTPTVRSGLKPPTSTSKIALAAAAGGDKKSCEVPAIQVRNSASSKTLGKNRCSGGSETSGYVGFNSSSPASSTEGSISMHSTSSKSSRGDSSPGCSPSEAQSSGSTPKCTKSTEEKPVLAVKGVTKKLAFKPLKRDSKASVDVVEKEEAKGPTVGVVSPMLNQRKFQEPDTTQINESSPSTSTFEKENPKKTAESALKCTDADVTEQQNVVEVPKMRSIRQPPSYNQLVQQGRICPSGGRQGFVDSSTSEDSLDSVTTTIRLKPTTSSSTACGYVSEGHSLESTSRSNATESSGYASESGVVMYARMRQKLREYDEATRRAHEYPDSFEDSSSLSSGISENLDDVSTDDLSGPDHSMASVAAYGKIGDYQHFVRSGNAKNGRSSSSSVDSRARRIAEQENIHNLLSQCRTSQRGAAAMTAIGQHSLRSPGYATIGGCSPQLALSADGDTLSVHSRASLRVAGGQKRPEYSGSPLSGFHSLDRKCQLLDYLSEHSSREADKAAMALVSPRRLPVDARPSSSTSAALNASGMSRSMILLESLSPRVSRRSNNGASPRGDANVASMRRAASPRTPRARIPLSIASPVHNNKGSYSARTAKEGGIYANLSDGMHLHKLTDDIYKSPSRLNRSSEMGSQLSLASSTAYASLNEKYESEIRKMARDLDVYRQTVSKLTKKQENYAKLFDDFNSKLSHLSRHIDKSQLKADEVNKLRHGIENLRVFSSRLASAHADQLGMDGAGELLRQPSIESVASHRSSMSSSSKSSKTDKSSLSSFGKTKKGWGTNVDVVQIRSSFTKAFSKKKNKSAATSDNEASPMRQLTTITGSHNRLDEIEVRDLRRQLEQRDEALTDVRLDALDRARQVDVLRETINKLKNENKQLKQDMNRLLTVRSRASSHASIPMLGDDEPFYEVPCQSSSGSASFSSKRSSGCNSVKVTVNVDLRGTINDVICPDNEIIVGFLPLPAKETTWSEMDQLLFALFQAYLERVDVERHLGLEPREAIIGYQMGDVRRNVKNIVPDKQPSEVLAPTTTIRMFLRGASQEHVDSLVLDTLLPKSMLDQFVRFVFTQRRLVLAGAAGLGKSKMARELAVYTSLRVGLPPDAIVDVKIPDESNEQLVQVEKQLEELLRAKKPCVVLIDNIPKNRIAFVASVFANVPLSRDDGPYVLCTVNRYQLVEMQVHQNFKMFLLTNCMEGVNGFMARFLRRRAVEAEYRHCRQTPSELVRVIQYLPVVLHAMNKFIGKTNSPDVTIGPRVFLQCPLNVDESRQWFIHLWNTKFIPYMEKSAREGKKNFGRCASFEDPTDVACENWPWLDGPPVEESLHRLSLQDLVPSGNTPRQPFNPLESLIQLHATNHAPIDNI